MFRNHNQRRNHAFVNHSSEPMTSGKWDDCMVIAHPENVFPDWSPEREGENGVYSLEYFSAHPEEFARDDKGVPFTSNEARELIEDNFKSEARRLSEDLDSYKIIRIDSQVYAIMDEHTPIADLPPVLLSRVVFLDYLRENPQKFPRPLRACLELKPDAWLVMLMEKGTATVCVRRTQI